MESNRIWVIEIKIGKTYWSPVVDRIEGISGVHYTRREAREAKWRMETTRKYQTRAQYRVRKYVSE